MDKWKMVPVEPTEAMLAEIDLVKGFTPMALINRYKALLAAAPAPAFDEAAEREKFEAWITEKSSRETYPQYGEQNYWIGWLACAKRKAGVQ